MMRRTKLSGASLLPAVSLLGCVDGSCEELQAPIAQSPPQPEAAEKPALHADAPPQNRYDVRGPRDSMDPHPGPSFRRQGVNVSFNLEHRAGRTGSGVQKILQQIFSDASNRLMACGDAATGYSYFTVDLVLQTDAHGRLKIWMPAERNTDSQAKRELVGSLCYRFSFDLNLKFPANGQPRQLAGNLRLCTNAGPLPPSPRSIRSIGATPDKRAQELV